MKDKKIILIIELHEKKPEPLFMELINFSLELSDNNLNDIAIIIAGKDINSIAEELSQNTGIKVYGMDGDCFTDFNYDIMATVLKRVLEKSSVEYICFLQTVHSSQLAPVLAHGDNRECLTSIESLKRENDKPVFTRSLFGGKIKMNISSSCEKKVLTILPGAFSENREIVVNDKYPNVEIVEYDIKAEGYHINNIIQSETVENPITDADVIISAGRGIEKEENLDLIKKCAALFKNSAVGASRTVCDRKWIPYSNQVGITGKTVAPKLYMACGISGSHQHIIGMKNSQIVVSINSDPNAAIFSISDFIVVEDLSIFLPLFIEKYNQTYK